LALFTAAPRSFLKCILLYLAIGLSACYHPGKVIFSDAQVAALHSDAFFSSINVHGAGERMTLKVRGVSDANVRGGKPFYITVPELESIVFVTGRSSNKATLHIVSNTDGRHLAIPLGGSDFGNFIGGEAQGIKVGEPGTDWVEMLDANSMRLVHRSFSGRSSSIVNFKNRTVEREPTILFDASGKVKARYLNGQRLPMDPASEPK
jgi:hypothetical protein